MERSDARASGAAQRKKGPAAIAGRRLLAQPGHRTRAPTKGGVIRASQKERARRRIAGESWNCTEEIAQRYQPGSSAWPARKDRKFTGSGRRPAKQSMRTCAVIGA